MFKNLSTKYLILIIILCFVISSIFAYLFVIELFNSTLLIGICIASFIVMSLATNQITSRIITRKFEKKYSNPKEYILEEDISVSLKGASCCKLSFGTSYLYINNDIAYKVLIIENNDLYFNNQEKENVNKKNSKLEKCTKYYGFEIFENVDEQLIKKLELYTFQNEKIYYTAFYKDNNKVIQANYEEPNENHLENYNFIINKLRMVSQ